LLLWLSISTVGAVRAPILENLRLVTYLKNYSSYLASAIIDVKAAANDFLVFSKALFNAKALVDRGQILEMVLRVKTLG
jgi:hypothetical protein